jgi:hypothetical protein
LREFEEIKSQCKAVEIIVNSKEENSEDFCLDFVQEFSLWWQRESKEGLTVGKLVFELPI